MTRRMLTREQTLNWNPDWSYTDREIIKQNLNRLNPRTLYVPPSGGYIGCIDGHGTKVMFLYPGYVEFKRELAPAGRPELDWPGLLLSTFRPRLNPWVPCDEDTTEVCPTHNIALPRTGICDECP